MMALILPSSLSPDFRLETCYVDANGNPAPEPPPAPADQGEPDPVEPLLAGASVEAGKDRARQCRACHTFEKGGRNVIGPNLYDVVGKPIAHGGDGSYPFSPALAAHHDEAWTVENLNLWLAKPRSFAEGNRMYFSGVASAKDRADIITYLKSLSDNPKQLTAASEQTAEVLRAFDLIGTWSTDCRKDVSRDYGSRVTYAVPPVGRPTITTVTHTGLGTWTHRDEILSAERVAENKIKLFIEVGSLNRLDNDDQPTATAAGKTEWIALGERTGSKMRLLDYRTSDGKVVAAKDGLKQDGLPTEPAEKCRNVR
jgi:cytochrome c